MIKLLSGITIALPLIFVLSSCKTDLRTEQSSVSKNIHFKMPSGFIKISVPCESRLKYDRIIRHRSKNLEIRYLSFPWEMKDTGTSAESTRSFKEKTVELAGLISGPGEAMNFSQFRKEDAETEFNADMGVSVSLKAGKNFSQEYKYIILMGIHNKGYGHAYMIFLLNKLENTSREIGSAFHSLTFTEEKSR